MSKTLTDLNVGFVDVLLGVCSYIIFRVLFPNKRYNRHKSTTTKTEQSQNLTHRSEYVAASNDKEKQSIEDRKISDDVKKIETETRKIPSKEYKQLFFRI